MNQKTKEIIYVDCCIGDSNDVYERFYLKGTFDDVDGYLMQSIVDSGYKPKEIEDIQDGYAVPTKYGDYEIYAVIEAILDDKQEIAELESYKIEDWNKQFFYHRIIDLSEIEN